MIVSAWEVVSKSKSTVAALSRLATRARQSVCECWHSLCFVYSTASFKFSSGWKYWVAVEGENLSFGRVVNDCLFILVMLYSVGCDHTSGERQSRLPNTFFIAGHNKNLKWST